jgi:hypothetical protein
MNFKKALTEEHSKALALQITAAVLKSPERLGELWDIITQEAPPLPQRASWALDTISEKAPHLFEPYVETAVSLMQQPVHNAIHRNVAKVLLRFELPEDLQGPMYDICLNKLMNPNEKVAVQVHCMSIAYNIASDIPELKSELAEVIESGMEYGSAGYRSRGKKLLKKLKE